MMAVKIWTKCVDIWLNVGTGWQLVYIELCIGVRWQKYWTKYRIGMAADIELNGTKEETYSCRTFDTLSFLWADIKFDSNVKNTKRSIEAVQQRPVHYTALTFPWVLQTTKKLLCQR